MCVRNKQSDDVRIIRRARQGKNMKDATEQKKCLTSVKIFERPVPGPVTRALLDTLQGEKLDCGCDPTHLMK